MNKDNLKAISWGLALALYLRFGLEPTGWLFYEASHALGVDWLYWGYSGFRAGGYAFSLWSHQILVCVVLGSLLALLLSWRARNRNSK